MKTWGYARCSTNEDKQDINRQIKELKAAGADGFVIGCLTADGYLDGEAMQPLLKAAEGCSLTLHRCIDVSCNLSRTYRDAASLGFDTVLTSGGAGNCKAGMDTIRELIRLREEMNGPEVLIGAGVKATVIGEFLQQVPGSQAFHMSGKTEIESGMRFRREGVPMGLPGLDEWHIQQTSEEAVRAARAVLNN
jgi:copper homeostasis protein